MSNIEQLLARLTMLPDHPNFVGTPVCLDGLDGVQLGSIWPVFRKALWLEPYDDPRRKFAHWLLEQISELELTPVLDENSGLAVFRDIKPGNWRVALEELHHLSHEPTVEIQREIVRIMGHRPDANIGGGIYEAYIMGLFAGGHGFAELQEEAAEHYKHSPHRLREFNILPELRTSSLFALVASGGYFISGKKYDFAMPDSAMVLAEDLTYVEFAQEVLTSAAKRIADIQSGKIPYKADGAFSTWDAQVISCAARIASYRDEPWLRPVIGPLLVGVCVAPTSAKTTPSQSLAITLGHSIEDIPTPESVRALREALSVVRHAGVKKKLSRNVKPAERALGERPNIALRMTLEVEPDKKQQAMLATCMESGFAQDMTLGYAEWRERLVDAAAGSPFATKVVWVERRADGSTQSFMVEADKGSVSTFGLGGPCTIDKSSLISLWHPLLVDDDERHGWQKTFLARKIKQPIRQVFREFYVPRVEELEKSNTSMFEDHILSVRTLIGLARREGWTINKYDGLSRQFGDTRVIFAVYADLYPGADGEGTSGRLHFSHKKGKRWEAVPIAQLDPLLFSEIARAADLLVSVAGFGLSDARSNMPVTVKDLGMHFAGQPAPPQYQPLHPTIARWQHLSYLSTLPLGVMVHNRKNTLAMVFAKQIEQGVLSIDERHLRISEYAVHLATARVTKSGEPCEIEPAPKISLMNRGPWLPYDEVLLQCIVDAVVSILGES